MTQPSQTRPSETDSGAIRVGLRVDVDTYSGTRDGVPTLLRLLADADTKASFFFTLGPDNMGRHVWRLFKPAFLWKMLRSNAPGLYGWDILLRGTFGSGPLIGRKLRQQIACVESAGHETGLHAWDHHYWQARADRMTAAEAQLQIRKAADEFNRVFGHPPTSSACAGWKCTDQVLLEKEKFGFKYNSDCRGTSVFRPIVGERVCVPQVPVTLPTYDEVIGRDGINDSNYNDCLLSLIKPGQLNVYTIHAEVEGMSRSTLFTEFLHKARQRHISFVPLFKLLDTASTLPTQRIAQGTIDGREGLVCFQGAAIDRAVSHAAVTAELQSGQQADRPGKPQTSTRSTPHSVSQSR